MKSTFRTALCALLGALALTSIATASASAEPCSLHTKAGSKIYQLCINGTVIQARTEVALETSSKAPLEIELNRWLSETSVKCTTVAERYARFNDTPGTALSAIFAPEASGCKLAGHSEVVKRCQFPESPKFNEAGAVMNSDEAIMLHSKGGAIYEWGFKGLEGAECPPALSGTHALTGKYECTLHGGKTEAVEHELQCAAAGAQVYVESRLTPLSYGETLSLSGTRKGEKFSIYEAT